MVDVSLAKSFLLDLAPQAGAILKRYFASSVYTQKQKEGVDFTTQADEEVDQFLRRKLSQKFPYTNFLTEETAPKDYSSCISTEDLWVIDPLDGTINFSVVEKRLLLL